MAMITSMISLFFVLARSLNHNGSFFVVYLKVDKLIFKTNVVKLMVVSLTLLNLNIKNYINGKLRVSKHKI